MQFFQKFRHNPSRDPSLWKDLRKIIGYTPKNKGVFETAFTHRSTNEKNSEGGAINFERLEFLGDSVIDTVVAAYLYQQLSNDNEGELTRMKSKIVSRERLNLIGKELQLLDHLRCHGKKHHFGDDIHGNLLEALIGAVFVEKGYERCKKVVFKVILDPYIALEEVKKEIISYKSVIIEWGQKNKHKVAFVTNEEESKDAEVNYFCKLYVNSDLLLKTRGSSKKRSEEKAAQRAYSILKVKESSSTAHYSTK